MILLYHEQLSWYIKPLLDFARAYSAHLFLRCCAASFSQTLKLAEGLEELRPATILPSPSRHVMARNADASGILDSNSWTRRHEKFYQSFRCREMVYAVWGSVIEEYLKAETTWVLTEMNTVAEKFQSDVSVFYIFIGRRHSLTSCTCPTLSCATNPKPQG